MKTFLSLVLLGLVLSNNQARAAGLSCEIDDSVSNGTNSVMFTLSPTPMEILGTFSGLKFPGAVLGLLDSPTNPAKLVTNTIMTQMKMLLRFSPFPVTLPTCQFLWSSSQLYCENVPSFIQKSLCGLVSGIKKITKPINFPLPQLSQAPLECENPQPWGLAKIGAQAAWARGARGQNVTVAGLDSGVRYTHEELKDNYRSFLGWYDAYGKYKTPTDETGHGTHTMGTVAGKTLGVAPDSKWIACKACDTTGCGEPQLKLCMEWLYCPDWKTNRTLNCTTRPQVINHSWGGGVGDTQFNTILVLMKNAGIFNFFSSGNSGPACFTVVSPADVNSTQMGTISVGATACNDNIASYSSAGPSTAADFMGGLGVELVAPGSNVLSAWFTGDNDTKLESGTSMSSPHAAGAAAVLLSSDPTLTLDQMRAALRGGAFRNPGVTSPLCFSSNLTSSEVWPNNVYGYGRIDLPASLDYITTGPGKTTL